MLPSILFIEKEDRTRALLQCRLTAEVKVKFAPCMEAAWEKLSTRKFDLILWNAACDPAAATNLDATLKRLSAKVSGSRIVVLANSLALKASPSCCDNIHVANLPANQEDLLALVESNLPLKASADQSDSNADNLGLPIDFEGIIAVSLPMRAVTRRAMDAAAVDIPVLITGETGTGKDLVAAAIHRRSSRKNRPYIPVNTGAMARELIASEIFGHEKGAYTGAQETRPGIFEQADGGTVFLDEVATMDEKTQVSLLRVLEEKTFRRVGGSKNIGTDVRVIAATNEDLEKNVADKRFREDLFYRLNVFPIRVPPLRERISAITALTNHFVSRFSAVYGKDVERVSPETYRILRRYSWPGNVRELKNVIQAAVLMIDGKELMPEFIPQRIREAVLGGERRGEATCSFRVGATLDGVANEFIRMTLAHVGGNKKLAAAVLGISRRALYNKIKRHQMP
ncbi:MAG: sigma-54 interaction domain-containing protein [Candidatus Binatia bacterium]